MFVNIGFDDALEKFKWDIRTEIVEKGRQGVIVEVDSPEDMAANFEEWVSECLSNFCNDVDWDEIHEELSELAN